MTLTEFELHRPNLGRQLRRMLEIAELSGNWEHGWNVTPRYDGGIRFVADHPIIDQLTCVGPEHPASMLEEEAPGCRGTWWWSADL